ncbi:substrate-binding domain-containing protein [Sphingopyxis sp. OPL5]|uniref:PstS family phosphate ABC transporter substrate-binding protein n=1 Tax=Sphingopyxis sp. OPL5 TaxID=2486273 RepID=UPI0008C4C992|nr:substrate-binding domain-containing protein [Sphingopyxis sp. OPL5]OHD00065.1 MAG: phosphate ABC transporter substrate-binding protein [Sphingopyxis sp. RIFCSPHIGHO2_01_FULL_65_24]QNO29007.1 substrate-binding domain-containing protein [Sphingopyxis sp. OPL5]
MKRIVTAALAALVLTSAATAQEASAPTTDADALSKARAIGNRGRAVKIFYEPQFDLTGLKPYVPQAQVTGTIRQWGNNYLKDSGLMEVWQAEFRKLQPGVSFNDNLYSSSVAFPGLISGAADVAPMGRQALWDELKGFEREGAQGGEEGVGQTEVVEIIMATGSYNVRGWSYALGIFVHKDNPLTGLTMEQVDGILGGRRDGGWNGLTWDTSVARGPEKNIRTWGQLGLKGEWANKPITVYGYNAKYHFNDEIDKKVLKGSGKWNEDMRAYSNVAGLKADGSLTAGGELITNGLAADKYGIAYTGIPFMNDSIKSVPLSTDGGKTFIPLTLQTVQNRSFPLTRDVYYYFRREKGKPVDPKVKEWLRYVLSRDGQAAIQADGKYLPLTPEVAAAQLAKLD